LRKPGFIHRFWETVRLKNTSMTHPAREPVRKRKETVRMNIMGHHLLYVSTA
jgi:hypothetical protein